MYKLLVVDDEQIVLDSVRFIVENHMGNPLHTETARSGREAIEKAETLRPDIVLMDIRMPGISGLEAMAEIKAHNADALFIVVTAYERFEFAKEALQLGAMDYINKPLSRDRVMAALRSAIAKKDAERRKLDAELELKEKMAFVLPVLENGFIYTMVFSDDQMLEMESFRRILDIRKDGGYVMTAEFGKEGGEEGLAGRLGASISSQQFQPMLREAMKESCDCIVGPVMLNRIIAYVPNDCDVDEYAQRLEALHTAADACVRLKAASGGAEFRIGIGKSYLGLSRAYRSYEESLRAIAFARQGGAFHINDIPPERTENRSYPDSDEKMLLKSAASGNADACLLAFERIYGWLSSEYGASRKVIAPALAELAMLLGRNAKECGASGSVCGDYLGELFAIEEPGAMKAWMKSRIRAVCEGITAAREKRLSGVVMAARDYIAANYCKDITLEDVSREVNISPNYFSKLFKDETGSNFIDYLTALRIDKAKRLLSDSRYANKEICYQIGYGDPNYFSRIFKKVVGVTPTEYRMASLGGSQ